MFKIRYFAPYAQQWRTETFDTKCQAEERIAFYRSCGSPADFA